jgi:hypothetical protein
VDEYVSLRTPNSIDEMVQPTIITRGCVVNVVNVVAIALDGESNDGTNNLEDFDTSSISQN